MADRGLWAIRGASVEVAIAAIFVVVTVVSWALPTGNLSVLVDNPLWLLFIVGLPATQGILVGAAIRHFHADLWEGAGLGLKIGILYGIILAIVVLIRVGTNCGRPGSLGSSGGSSPEPEWCWIFVFGLIIIATLFLVVLGVATGLVVSWMYSRHPRISYR